MSVDRRRRKKKRIKGPGRGAGGERAAAPAPAHRRGPTSLRHLGSGKYSDVFKVSSRGRGEVVMKVSYYRDDTLCKLIARARAGDEKGARRARRMDSIQVANAFGRVSSSLVRRGVSPHFVLVFCDVDCRAFAARMGALLEERLAALTPLQKRYNNVCFMEVFHTNLTKFLVGSTAYDDDLLRQLVFQVLFTLAALQRRFPGFRHNDLSTNNVLVKKGRVSAAYTLGGGGSGPGSGPWYVDTPVLVALSDYDFTHVPGHPELSNERVLFGKYKVDGRRNDSYDAHFFLKSVGKCIAARAARLPAASAFLRGLGLADEDRQNDRVFPRLRPAALLRDPYFDALRKPRSVAARYRG